MAPEQLRPRRRAVWSRALRAVGAELAPLHPRLLAVDLLVRLLPPLAFQRLRTALYRLAGLSIGERSILSGRLDLIGPGPIATRLTIGAGCWLNALIFADLTGTITIGDNVSIGHHVTFITAGHEIGTAALRAGAVIPGRITVEDGAWIGAGVTLLPGARVGAGTVVGAGSLVTGALPPGVVAVGRPARPVRALDWDEGQAHHLQAKPARAGVRSLPLGRICLPDA